MVVNRDGLLAEKNALKETIPQNFEMLGDNDNNHRIE